MYKNNLKTIIINIIKICTKIKKSLSKKKKNKQLLQSVKIKRP